MALNFVVSTTGYRSKLKSCFGIMQPVPCAYISPIFNELSQVHNRTVVIRIDLIILRHPIFYKTNRSNEIVALIYYKVPHFNDII